MTCTHGLDVRSLRTYICLMCSIFRCSGTLSFPRVCARASARWTNVASNACYLSAGTFTAKIFENTMIQFDWIVPRIFSSSFYLINATYSVQFNSSIYSVDECVLFGLGDVDIINVHVIIIILFFFHSLCYSRHFKWQCRMKLRFQIFIQKHWCILCRITTHHRHDKLSARERKEHRDGKKI